VLRFSSSMSGSSQRNAEKFDQYANEYERLHAENVAITGEETDYFAYYKVECLERKGVASDAKILDFGCGIGNVTSKLSERFTNLTGYEPSPVSAERARQRVPRATIHHELGTLPEAQFDVAVLSCVLHHVQPAERAALMQQVVSKLRSGGRLFVFEHNPLNPVTRRAVATCAFDDDAVLLWPWEAKRLLQQSGFQQVGLDYIVFFPKPLSFLRGLEPRLGWLPAGAQQLVIGTKP
jgi:SAM-dependent methyltransferase